MNSHQPLNNQTPDSYQNPSVNFSSTYKLAPQNHASNLVGDDSPRFDNFLQKQNLQHSQDEGEVLNDDYDRPFRSYFSFMDPNKKYSNLAAIDCFATIYGQNYYQKTYQDQLRVDQLVGDVLLDERPLNIDKLFRSQDSSNYSQQQNNKNCITQHQKKHQDSLNTMGQMQISKSPGLEDSILMVSPEYYNQTEEDQTHCLQKLFEDPDEKQLMIKNNIAKSQIKKRKRLNSGVSNQSKVRSSSQYQPKYICNKTMENNSDLLKQFNQDIQSQNISLDYIQQSLQSYDIHQKVISAFEFARTDIRMEDPTRLLTRLGLNLVKILFSQQISGVKQQQQQYQQMQGENIFTPPCQLYHDNCRSGSDNMSISQSIYDNNQSISQTNLSRKRYQQWTYDDEQKLKDYINNMNKSINDLNDTDLSELARKLHMPPQQIFNKAKRFTKEEDKKETQTPSSLLSYDNKTPKKDMIARALNDLPNKRGTKKEIFQKVEHIYNVKLNKNDSTYKTIDQALSKYFYKSPQEYLLNMSIDYSKFDVGNDPKMKQMLISCMLKMKDFRGDIKQIKTKMVQLYGDKLRSEYIDRTRSTGNLQEWEKTMLKTFSRHKDVFSKAKAVYSLNNNSNQDEYSRIHPHNNSMSLIVQDRSAQGPEIVSNDDQTMNYSISAGNNSTANQNQSFQNQTNQSNQTTYTNQIQIITVYQT